MKKIVLLSGNHICHNPRSVKEAETLSRVGYKVVVVGGAFSDELRKRDQQLIAHKPWQFEYGYDLTQNKGLRFLLKAQKKIGEIAFQKLRIANRWEVSYGVSSLLSAARRHQADLTIAHWDPALPAAYELLRDGKKIGVDMEDWFSEDIQAQDKNKRPVKLLKKYEQKLLSEGVHSSCTSEAMADALVRTYGCRRPVVIRNVFGSSETEALDGQWKDRPGMVRWMGKNDPSLKRPKEAPVSIHWVSQTIGPNRGLESLFQALSGIQGNWELNLRGNIKGYENWLKTVCPTGVHQRLTIHKLVENEQLLSRIAEHEIGFCGELKTPINKDLTISNKLFQYLQGGLTVVASDTEGQREAAEEAGEAIEIVTVNSPIILREILQRLLQDHALLASRRSKAWEAGKNLCWENESSKLLESIERAI